MTPTDALTDAELAAWTRAADWCVGADAEVRSNDPIDGSRKALWYTDEVQRLLATIAQRDAALAVVVEALRVVVDMSDAQDSDQGVDADAHDAAIEHAKQILADPKTAANDLLARLRAGEANQRTPGTKEVCKRHSIWQVDPDSQCVNGAMAGYECKIDDCPVRQPTPTSAQEK